MTKREDPGHVVPIEEAIRQREKELEEASWIAADPNEDQSVREGAEIIIPMIREALARLRSDRDAGETVEVMF